MVCSAERVDLSSLGQRDSEMSYSGAGIDLAMDLVEAAQGGQVMLSETAWASVQDRLPGSTQVSIPASILSKSGMCNIQFTQLSVSHYA